MEIWRFINSPEKAKIVLLVISLTIFILPICNTTTLTITEGDLEQLDFQYPCNISNFTFQYGNRAPSYYSANPTSVSLPYNHHLTIKNESESNECSLHLTIDPVLRDDEGTYILTVYDENYQYMYDTKIGLRVNYPPGRASCESGVLYIEEWIRIQCSARAGNLAGQIICYQNGARLPPLTQPEENGGIVNQNILARLEGLVYCCSTTLQETTDMCECKDTGWDPLLNTASINVTNPCPVVLGGTQDPTISQSLTGSELATKTTTTTPELSRNWKDKIADLLIVVTTFVVIFFVFVFLPLLIFIAVIAVKIYRKDSTANRS